MADWKNSMRALAREVWIDVACGVCDDADDAICGAVEGHECVIYTHHQIDVWGDEGDHGDLCVGKGEPIHEILNRNAGLHCTDAARAAYADLPDPEKCREEWLGAIALSALDTRDLNPETHALDLAALLNPITSSVYGFDGRSADPRIQAASEGWLAEWLVDLVDRVVDCATMICERGHEATGAIDPEPLPEDFDEMRGWVRDNGGASPLPAYYETLFVETWRARARALNAPDEA